MSQERTVYANLSDEQIEARAEFKIDVFDPKWAHRRYGAFVKRRFWVFSWWECVFHDYDLERCTEYLQTLIQLPRRFTRKVATKP